MKTQIRNADNLNAGRLEADANCTGDHHDNANCVGHQEGLPVDQVVESGGEKWLHTPDSRHDTDVDVGQMRIIHAQEDRADVENTQADLNGISDRVELAQFAVSE